MPISFFLRDSNEINLVMSLVVKRHVLLSCSQFSVWKRSTMPNETIEKLEIYKNPDKAFESYYFEKEIKISSHVNIVQSLQYFSQSIYFLAVHQLKANQYGKTIEEI